MKGADVINVGVMILILPILIYLCYLLCGGKAIKGCGEKCNGQCKMSRNANKMQDLDITFVKMEGCIHCERLMNLLKENNVDNLVNIVDSNSPKVEELMKKYGNISGFPTLISASTKKMIVGGRKDLEQIITDLS